jgi:hypothetical protein
MKTAETIEAAASGKKPKAKAGKYGPGENPNSLKNLIAPWTSETAPKSAGRPKKDHSQIIARQIFENNEELIYKAFCKALAKGQAFAFQVLSDRAYGKLVQKQETGAPGDFQELDESGIDQRIKAILQDLGLARAIDEAGRTSSANQGTRPTNGEAKTSDVLS